MAILFIDDLRDPPPSLVGDIIVARTSVDALNILKTDTQVSFDEIWFDHDLGGDDTTMPVVDYLCYLSAHDTPASVGRFVVHSANPVGVRTILASFRRYYPQVPTLRVDYGSLIG